MLLLGWNMYPDCGKWRRLAWYQSQENHRMRLHRIGQFHCCLWCQALWEIADQKIKTHHWKEKPNPEPPIGISEQTLNNWPGA
jgi:hypothetical protein